MCVDDAVTDEVAEAVLEGVCAEDIVGDPDAEAVWERVCEEDAVAEAVWDGVALELGVDVWVSDRVEVVEGSTPPTSISSK